MNRTSIQRQAFGRMSARWRAEPDFLVVGAMKAGTTSLFSLLMQHPQVRAPQNKELHFFSSRYHRRSGLWYRGHFPVRGRAHSCNWLTGEATPTYLFHPYAAERIRRHLPRVRIIVLLRNPVDRAVSHYWHEANRGRETRPMTHAFFARESVGTPRVVSHKPILPRSTMRFSYLSRGDYHAQLLPYYRHFEPEQIAVVSSERFFAHTASTVRRLHRWLGLKAHGLSDVSARNTGRYQDSLSGDLRSRLDDHFAPANDALWRLLEVAQPWW